MLCLFHSLLMLLFYRFVVNHSPERSISLCIQGFMVAQDPLFALTVGQGSSASLSLLITSGGMGAFRILVPTVEKNFCRKEPYWCMSELVGFKHQPWILQLCRHRNGSILHPPLRKFAGEILIWKQCSFLSKSMLCPLYVLKHEIRICTKLCV